MRNLEFLSVEENLDYLDAAVPAQLDREIRAFVDSVTTVDEYHDVRRRITDDHVTVLVAFAERAATLAVRQGEDSLLVSGVVAACLGGFPDKSREAALVLPLLFNSAKKMDVGARRLIDDVEARVGREQATMLRRFRRQPPWMRSLKAMHYRETTDPNARLLYEKTHKLPDELMGRVLDEWGEKGSGGTQPRS